jgi:predicted aspartyl protease
MIIERKLLFEGAVGEKYLTALFDSGATYSCIRPDLTDSLDKLIPVRHPFRVELAQKGKDIKITQAIRLDFYIDNYHFSDEFMIIPDLSEEVIIGAGTMQKWHLKLDFEKGEIIIDPKVTRLKLV